MQNMVPKLPDWMSEAVLCVDCHKPALDGFSFKAVREYCIEWYAQHPFISKIIIVDEP